MQGLVLLGLHEAQLQPLAANAALLPCGQVPLIDLTLGWLQRNGINEVNGARG